MFEPPFYGGFGLEADQSLAIRSTMFASAIEDHHHARLSDKWIAKDWMAMGSGDKGGGHRQRLATR
jgi:hypothetical protein